MWDDNKHLGGINKKDKSILCCFILQVYMYINNIKHIIFIITFAVTPYDVNGIFLNYLYTYSLHI